MERSARTEWSSARTGRPRSRLAGHGRPTPTGGPPLSRIGGAPPGRAIRPPTKRKGSNMSSTPPETANIETATLGGGCFWCLEAVFKDLKGVSWVMSGYAGGHLANPSYKAVCGGRTGHAEVVQVKFDANQLSYADLLRVFFSIHDPT